METLLLHDLFQQNIGFGEEKLLNILENAPGNQCSETWGAVSNIYDVLLLFVDDCGASDMILWKFPIQ